MSQSDEQLARAVQRQILGPGAWVAPCGCILNVWGNFPKKSWIYPVATTRRCSDTCSDGPACGRLWIDKRTGVSIPLEEFEAAWDAAKKCGCAIRDVLVVPVSATHGVRREGLLEVRTFEVSSVESPHRANKIVWPPKMSEVFTCPPMKK